MNIDDASLLDDITAVQEAAKKILENKKIDPDHELDKKIDMVPTEEKKKNDTKNPDDDTRKNPKHIEETNAPTEEIKTPKNLWKENQLEKFKIENWKENPDPTVQLSVR